jgi:hypothetical protein
VLAAHHLEGEKDALVIIDEVFLPDGYELEMDETRRYKLPPRWSRLRKMVFMRDGGYCQVCFWKLDYKLSYTVGHIIDRCVGGSNQLFDTVAMCDVCNFRLKPVHRTHREYIDWVKKCRQLWTGNSLWPGGEA